MFKQTSKVGFGKSALFIALLSLSALFSSCRKELENLNKEAWTPEIGIPLFYSKITGSDIAYDWLRASSVLIDSSQVITVIYESEGKYTNLSDSPFFNPSHYNILDFQSINIAQTNSSTFISLGKFSDDFSMMTRDSIWNNHGSTTMLPPLSNENSYDNKLKGFSQIEDARTISVITGNLTISITNSTPYTLSANLSLVDANGNQLNDSDIHISALAPTSSFTHQLTISNKQISFPIKANFTGIYAPQVLSMVDTAMQGISVSLTFSQLTIDKIEGQFENLMLGSSELRIAPHPIFFMDLSRGELVVRTNCSACSNVNFNITFPTVTVNGQPLTVSARANATTTVPISNSIWRLPMPSRVPINVSISSSSPNGTYSTPDSSELFVSIQNFKFNSAQFLPPKSEVSISDTLHIPFFARTQGNTEFMEPYLETQFINRILSKIPMSISNIINSNGDYLISPHIGSFISLDPAPMENFTAQSFLFDVNNSNIKAFVNSQPAYVYAQHIVLLNDTIKLSDNNSSVGFKSSLALPFKGSVSGLLASDTTILKADILENTKDATLYITATNYFPLQTKVFILTATLPLDTIATITIPPNTTQQNRLVTEVYLNESAVQRLKSDKRIIITAIFDSPPTTPTITIKSSQYFEIHAGVNTVIEY